MYYKTTKEYSFYKDDDLKNNPGFLIFDNYRDEYLMCRREDYIKYYYDTALKIIYDKYPHIYEVLAGIIILKDQSILVIRRDVPLLNHPEYENVYIDTFEKMEKNIEIIEDIELGIHLEFCRYEEYGHSIKSYITKVYEYENIPIINVSE